MIVLIFSVSIHNDLFYLTTRSSVVKFDLSSKSSNVGTNKTSTTMNIYFGINFFYVPLEHVRMIEDLKKEFQKWPLFHTFNFLLPTKGNINDVSWCTSNRKTFLQDAHALIVDATHTPPVNQRFKNLLWEHHIVLIETKKTSNPRSCPELNSDPVLIERMSMLEYKETIMEVRSHILVKMCLHHAQKYLIKSI
jgi:hypothetical protein